MYCRECGNSVSDKAEICTNCGVRPLNANNFCQSCGENTKPEQELCIKCGSRVIMTKKGSSSAADEPSGLVNFAACCFPIVGLILYFVWKNEKPRSAKSVCKWAVIGFVLGIVLYGIGILFGIASEMMYYY